MNAQSNVLGAIAAIVSSLPGSVDVQPLVTAQNSLVGQCRAANRATPVYTEASTVSAAMILLAPDQEVTLNSAVDGNGFVAIRAPQMGYVKAAVLKVCNDPLPPSRCRRVIFPEAGLIIFQRPSAGSMEMGRVGYLEEVELTTLPPTTQFSQGRNWVEIAKPAQGWISNSRAEFSPESNLGMCGN